MSTSTKTAIKKMLLGSGMLNIANRFRTRTVSVLKYHSVQDNPEMFDDSIGLSIIHDTRTFSYHIETIAKHYNAVSMDDVLKFLTGEGSIPERAVAITFDDGFADNYEIAAQILDYYRVPATFYITVGSIESKRPIWFMRIRHALWTTGKSNCTIPSDNIVLPLTNRKERLDAMRKASQYCASLSDSQLDDAVHRIEQSLGVNPYEPEKSLMMSWKQIVDLHHSGHLIGSHSISHSNIAHLKNSDLHKELDKSKKILEQRIGKPVVHFSYPNPALNPHLNDKTTNALAECGYKTAVISTPAGLVYSDSDPFTLKRVWVPPKKEDFLWHLEWSRLGRNP